jgi:hypothetical protein
MTNSDWIGAIGVAITLIAYFCMSFKWIGPWKDVFFAQYCRWGHDLLCILSYFLLAHCGAGGYMDNCVTDWSHKSKRITRPDQLQLYAIESISILRGANSYPS